jgi:hypothetical protein
MSQVKESLHGFRDRELYLVTTKTRRPSRPPKAKPNREPNEAKADSSIQERARRESATPQLNRENKETNETHELQMGRISFLSKISPPPILVAHAHHHRQYHHYNASNASPLSFLLLIATVAAGEVLAIFVCKIIADYGELTLK